MSWLSDHLLAGLLSKHDKDIADLKASPPGSASFSSLSGVPSDNAALTSALAAKASISDLTAHTGNTSNPHSVIKAQVGLGSIPNPDSANTTDFLRRDGAWAAPSGGSGGGVVEDLEANRPAAGTQGRTFLPSNGYYKQIDTGSLWNTYVKDIKCSPPPVASDFAAVYTTAQDSLIDTIEGLELKRVATGSSQGYRSCYVKALPSAPYAFVVGINIKAILQAAYCGIGICLTDGNSGTPKLTTFAFAFRGTAYSDLYIQRQYWTNSTTVSNENNISLINWTIPYPLVWMRIRDDSTNRYYELSADRVNWIILETKTRLDFLTPTHCGLILDSTITATAGTVLSKARIFDWSLA